MVTVFKAHYRGSLHSCCRFIVALMCNSDNDGTEDEDDANDDASDQVLYVHILHTITTCEIPW